MRFLTDDQAWLVLKCFKLSRPRGSLFMELLAESGVRSLASADLKHRFVD